MEGHAMVQKVSRRPLTADSGIRLRFSIFEIYGWKKVALGQVLLRVLPFSPVSSIPPWLSPVMYHVRDEQ
jgi:hypothetical protein